ncbi:MAG: beta-glucuronidase [Chitinophagaceae bacterium BSSC1]|nr:MAG: beta-glucuronidase [Chitinophagaceae bacterium BSSC1]
MRVKIGFAILFLLFSGNLLLAQSISLAGNWQFKADSKDSGIVAKWFQQQLPERVHLPGSMAENGKGDEVSLKTKWTGSIYDSSFFFNPRLKKYREPGNLKIPFWLTPAKHYVGVAWYQKQIQLPKDWKNKRWVLSFERAHIETRVWIDDQEIGMRNSLVTAHEYDLTEYLKKGTHTISVRIDNRIDGRPGAINVGPDSHSVTDHTSGNWNGLTGKLELKPSNTTWVDNLQVYPDIHQQLVLLKLQLKTLLSGTQKGNLRFQIKPLFASKAGIVAKQIEFQITSANDSLEVVLPIGKSMQLWDEFHPNLYQLTTIIIDSKGNRDTSIQNFGMREIEVVGKQILVNGRPVSLRGTVNNSEFPITGYPATDLIAWEKIFKVAKAHGLNHFRFHSFCPPEAAFQAADKVGIYLQPEGPSWPNHGTSLGDGRPIDAFLWAETERMVRNYGNYASFCMLSAGNEPAGRNQAKWLADFILKWKARDNRRIYTGASVAMSWPLVPENDYMIKSGSRGLSWGKGPESLTDYSEAIKSFSMPYITHEMGQWCAYPDFNEIKQFTGVYKARNYEMFQEDLKDRGMADMAEKFLASSGKLQLLCYKAEIEKSLRTPGLGGFQLLGLQDFPGQGTALVGTMNVFWNDKPYSSAKAFARFCNSTVPLMKTSKFVYSNAEHLKAAIEVYHFGEKDLDATIQITFKDPAGKIVSRINSVNKKLVIAAQNPIVDVDIDLATIQQPTKLTLEVSIANTVFANDWEFWVYPVAIPASDFSSIYDCTVLDDAALKVLDAGGKVFLNLAGRVTKGKEIVQNFTPVFWNTSWFKMRPPHTLGFVVDPNHPAFKNFPTEYHSNFQWWSLVNKAQVMHLEDFPSNLRPLVQPIDTWFINRRLASVFEVRIGRGKLLVSSLNLANESNLDKLKSTDALVARQLYSSLHQYMLSDKFQPQLEVDPQRIKDLTEKPSKEIFDPFTKDSPDELKKTLPVNKQ